MRRVKSVRVPYDAGRLPTNIFDHDGLSGVTAAQWKLYIITYARPCLYKLLSSRAYKSLVLLSEIVILIAAPMLSCTEVATLCRLLHEHHLLFSRVSNINSSRSELYYIRVVCILVCALNILRACAQLVREWLGLNRL